jgi:hypothetical protein
MVLLVAAPQPAAAQDSVVGVKVGVNFATLDFDEGDTEENKGLTGLMAGVFFIRPIDGNFGVQIEGLISQKGTKVEDDFFDEELEIKLNYLEIPVLARYELPFGTGDSVFHVYAGPTFGIKLSDSQKIDGEDLDDDFERDVKGSDIGLAFGGGVSFDMWVIDLRYTHGLTNINDDVDADDFDVKNRVFTIAVGYRFR